MHLIQLKSKNFPTKITVDLNDLEMAKGFQKLLPGDFTLVVNKVGDPAQYAGVNYVEIKGSRRLRSLYMFFWWPWFFYRLKRQHPAEKVWWLWLDEPTLLVITAFWSKFFHYRILLEFIGSFRQGVEKPMYKLARALTRIQSAALSETARQLLISFDQRYASDSFVLRTGYSPESFEQTFNPTAVRQELGLATDDFLVSYVGHFETNGPKGAGLMIEALKHIANPKVKVYLIGGYPEEINHFSKLAENLGVAERVVFVPWQRDLKKAMHYASAADVMAVPTSHANDHNRYSFPVKVWEYLALGKPVISSDLPINREVLNENNARFFQLGDAQDFAKQVAQLESDRALCYRLAENAKLTSAGFTWPERAKKVVDFINIH